MGTWAVALHAPCKPSRSWRSLLACPTAPPHHRSPAHAQTHRKSNAPAKSYIHTQVCQDIHILAWVQACTWRHVSLQKVSVHTYLKKMYSNKQTHTHTHTHTDTRTCPLATLLVHRATGRLCSIPLKVLWAVISKTIPWMAALIENNEGHIEHMVAVVSPFPPSSLLFSPSLTLSLSPTPPDKRFSQTLPLPSKDLCGEWKKKGHRQSCSRFLLTS